MTVEVEYELHPITKLDFEPRCDMETGVGTNEQCTHKAVWSALVLHGNSDEDGIHCGTAGHVVLFCTCCVTRVCAAIAAHLPGRCADCGRHLTRVADYVTDIARLT